MAWKSLKVKLIGLRALSAFGLLTCVCFIALISVTRSTPLEAHAQPLAAPATPPQFKVQTMYNGYYRDGEWATLRVQLQNGRQPWRGEVRANLSYSPDNNYNYNHKVELSSDQNSSFFFYVFLTRAEPRLEIGLYDAGGQQIALETLKLQLIVGSDYIIGTLTDPDKVIVPRPGVTKIRQSDARSVFVPLAPADLPDRSDALNTFDALLIGDVEAGHLTALQWRILAGWVSEGGRLWLSGGATFPNLTKVLDPAILPARSEGQTQAASLKGRFLPDALLPVLNANPNQSLTLQKLTAQPGAVVTTRQEGPDKTPLIIAKAYGRGSVVATALDLLAPPFLERGEANAYWSAMADSANAAPDNAFLRRSFFDNDIVLRTMATQPPTDLPDATVLLILLVVYSAGVVSGSYWLARRMDKPLLVLMCFPAIALIAGAAIWTLGASRAAGQVHLNRIGMAAFYADSLPANVKSFGVSVGAATDQENYILKLSEPANAGSDWLYRPQNLALPNQQLPGVPPQGFSQNSPKWAAELQSASNRVTQLQIFGTQGGLEKSLPIEASLSVSPEGNGLLGTISNSTNLNLSEVVLVQGENFLSLGDLAAGESRSINFNFNRTGTILQRQSIERGLYGSNLSNRASTEDSALSTEDWQRNLRWVTLNAAYLNGRFAPLYQNYPLYLTGWLNGKAAEQLLGTTSLSSNLSLREQDALLLIKVLPFSYQVSNDPTRLIVPSTTLQGSRLAASDVSFVPIDSSAKMEDNAVLTIQYRLPPGTTARPDRLSLLVNSRLNDRNGPPASPQLELWDWAQQSWHIVANPGDTRTRLDLGVAEIANLIDADGFIRIRATSKGGVHILQQLNFEYEGLRQ